MRDQPLAPLEGIAGVVPRAIEELAEIQVEVAQERLKAVYVRERDAEVAAVFGGPLLEREIAKRERLPLSEIVIKGLPS